jgi:cytoskeleton protein RodZ
LLRDEGRGTTRPATAAKVAPSAVELPLGGAPVVSLQQPSAPLPDAPSSTQTTQADGSPGGQAAGTPSLHFVFEEDSWVEVRDRQGRPILSKLAGRGSEETVTGEGPFSVVIGNAKAVRLTYNGKPIDLAPHTRVKVARLTLE